MERLESRRSNRIARFLGSRRVGQMRVDADLMNKERDELLNFLLRSFVLCGRVS
jgi:RNA-dependent RNA polymerase